MNSLNKCLGLIILCALMMLSACSSSRTNELEEQHAYFSDDTHNSIEYKGVTYSQVSVEDIISDRIGQEIGFAGGLSRTILITDKGEKLPASIRDYKGQVGQIFGDTGVLIAGGYYVTDERRDSFLEAVQYADVTEYAVMINGTEEVLLNSEQVECLERILNGEDYVMTEDERAYCDAAGSEEVILGLFLTDKDRFFSQTLASIIFPEGKNSKLAEIHLLHGEDGKEDLVIREEDIKPFLELVSSSEEQAELIPTMTESASSGTITENFLPDMEDDYSNIEVVLEKKVYSKNDDRINCIVTDNNHSYFSARSLMSFSSPARLM